MANEQKIPPNNLGLYRLDNFVGRAQELSVLRAWLDHHPIVAITGPSGVGKSTLATAVAVAEASRFEQGILWISATGEAPFYFYDIVRDIEDVLATGITNQPVSSWPLLVLQQLYGFNRLLIMDELANTDEDTVQKIISMISPIGPGGEGRFILVGRTIPQPLLDLVGEAHLHLEGIDKIHLEIWIDKYKSHYPLTRRDISLLYQLTGGHPLALKVVASLWHNSDRTQLLDLVSAQNPDDQRTYLRAVFKAALIILTKKYPRLGQLLVQCSQSSGGFSEDAVQRLYWLNFAGDISATQAAQQLFTLGLLTYDSHEERYYIHPMVRRYLRAIGSDILDFSRQDQHAFDHARYYLTLAQRYSRTSPTQWGTLDSDWGNIRKAFDFLTDSLEKALSLSVEQILATIDTSGLPALPTGIDETLILIRDYALALSTYVIWRHPPEARRWMTVGIIASRGLADRRAEALIGVALAILAYFHHDYLMAQRWYRHSLPFFKEFHEYPRVVQITKNLGTVFRAINNLDEAFKMYEEALALATEHDFQADQSEIQLLIGSLYYHQKEYQAAIDHYLQALDIDRERRNEAWQAVHYNNLGLAMEASGNYERAIEYYKQAIDLHKRVDNKRGLSMTCGNLGAAYYQLGRLDEALKWYMQDMKIRDSIGNWLDKAAILHNMGHVALEMDDLDPAASYFTQSRDIYREFGQNELADEEQVLVDTVQDRRTIFG